jgi:hypothetical protein
MGLDAKTYWLTDRQSQCDFDFDFLTAVSDEARHRKYRRLKLRGGQAYDRSSD